METKGKADVRESFISWLRLGSGLIFILLGGAAAALVTRAVPGLEGSETWILMAAASVGVYMAMNIGANDVANNLGPAVGSVSSRSAGPF